MSNMEYRKISVTRASWLEASNDRLECQCMLRPNPHKKDTKTQWMDETNERSSSTGEEIIL